MINPIATRIEEILNAQTRYAIPSYQRDFKWGETEARELVEDLDSYSGLENEQLFLGSFIFESAKDQQTYIIDGQQRLTTLMLLLIACRKRAHDLSLHLLEAAIQTKLTYVDSATAESMGSRFVASDSIRDIFEHMTAANWQGDFPAKLGGRSIKRQVNRIRPVFQFFSSRVSEFSKEELSAFLRALYDAYVIRIAISSDEEAFKVFERTNARGMDLEIADLLKNYLFSQGVESIEDRWNDIVDSSRGTLLRMLKYFYVARAGYVQKPQLYRELKKIGKEEGSEKLTYALADFARFYTLTKIATPDAAREYFTDVKLDAIAKKTDRFSAMAASLAALQEFKITQFIPVAYSAVDFARRADEPNDEARAKSLIRLFEALEKYHFVNNVVCERVGNEVERLYADTCLEWSRSKSFASSIDTFINALRTKRASIDEFRGRFAELSYTRPMIPVISYIFDRFNNYGLDVPQRLPIFVPGRQDTRKPHNIEHFLAQNPTGAIVVDDDTAESIDNIGNLLPLYFKDNSRLGNRSPLEKVQQLTGPLRNSIQNLTFVQNFLEKYGASASAWTAEAIRTRAKDLADQAYYKVWAF